MFAQVFNVDYVMNGLQREQPTQWCNNPFSRLFDWQCSWYVVFSVCRAGFMFKASKKTHFWKENAWRPKAFVECFWDTIMGSQRDLSKQSLVELHRAFDERILATQPYSSKHFLIVCCSRRRWCDAPQFICSFVLFLISFLLACWIDVQGKQTDTFS